MRSRRPNHGEPWQAGIVQRPNHTTSQCDTPGLDCQWGMLCLDEIIPENFRAEIIQDPNCHPRGI